MKLYISLLILLTLFSCEDKNQDSSSLNSSNKKAKIILNDITIEEDFPIWFFGKNMTNDIKCSYVLRCNISLIIHTKNKIHFIEKKQNFPSNKLFLSYSQGDSICIQNLYITETNIVQNATSRDKLNFTFISDKINSICNIKKMNALRESLQKSASLCIYPTYTSILSDDVQRANNFEIYPIDFTTVFESRKRQ